MAAVTLLREDGSGRFYSHPGTERDRHLKLPHAFWLEGPGSKRWFRVLDLPETAMLLIATGSAPTR